MPTWGWHAIRVGVILLVILLVIWRVDWGSILSAFHLDNIWLLVLAVMANFISVLLKGLAWKGVVDGLPTLKKKTRYMDLLSPLMVGFLFNSILAARVGEIAKVLLARRRLARRGEDLSPTVVLGTVVVENIITTVAWVFLVILIGIFLPLPSYAWIITAVLGVICLVVLLVALLQRPQTQVPDWLNTGSLWRRAVRAVRRLWAAVHESHVGLRTPAQMASVAVPSLGTWLAQWAGIYFTLSAFGLGYVGWGGRGPAAGHHHPGPVVPDPSRQPRGVSGCGDRAPHGVIRRECRGCPRLRHCPPGHGNGGGRGGGIHLPALRGRQLQATAYGGGKAGARSAALPDAPG